MEHVICKYGRASAVSKTVVSIISNKPTLYSILSPSTVEGNTHRKAQQVYNKGYEVLVTLGLC